MFWGFRKSGGLPEDLKYDLKDPLNKGVHSD